VLDIEVAFEAVLKKAAGTGSGTIVNLVLELINILRCMHGEIQNVHLQVHEMSEEIPHVPTIKPVPGSELSVPKGDTTKRANKSTTGKAKKTTKRSI
jgi:hypothetical protein